MEVCIGQQQTRKLHHECNADGERRLSKIVWGGKVKIQQQMHLKQLMGCFECDYKLAEQLHSRQIELLEAVEPSSFESELDRAMLRVGVRPDVLAAAKESVEYEEVMASFISELTGIIGRWDLADQLDTARNAA